MQVYLPLSNKSEIIRQHSASILKTDEGVRCELPCFALPAPAPARPRPGPREASASAELAIFIFFYCCCSRFCCCKEEFQKKWVLWPKLQVIFRVDAAIMIIDKRPGRSTTNWNRDTPHAGVRVCMCVCDNFIRERLGWWESVWWERTYWTFCCCTCFKNFTAAE